MNVKSSSLISSIGGAGLRVIAGLRICLIGTIYFFLLLSANLLTARYAGRMPEMASGISIVFDFLNFFDFFDDWGFWGSAGAVALVLEFSTCDAEGIVVLVLRCSSTDVLTALRRDSRCWQWLGQKANLSQLMSKIIPCFCIHGLPRIKECWPSLVIKNGANNLVWSYTVNVR